jgi:hypothetical protein
MGKPAKVPFSNADLNANRDRTWTDTAETIAVIGCGAGVALSLIFKQAAFAIVPPIFAISFNIINRTHRLQSTRNHAVAAVRQADHLRTDLNNLTTALHALPIGDRVLEIEDYLYRVNAALVQLQQRQETIAAAAEEDREKIKEAFSIVRQGVYNLNDYTNATVEEIRGELAQLRQALTDLPQALPHGLAEPSANAMIRQSPGPIMPTSPGTPMTIDLTPVQYNIDRLDERYSRRSSASPTTSASFATIHPKSGSNRLIIALNRCCPINTRSARPIAPIYSSKRSGKRMIG